MKGKLIALGAVIIVFLFLSSLRISVPVNLPKLRRALPITDWAEDTTVSQQKLKYLDRVYESANY